VAGCITEDSRFDSRQRPETLFSKSFRPDLRFTSLPKQEVKKYIFSAVKMPE
jgi:hypothetical protein